MRSRTVLLLSLLVGFASPGTTAPRTFDLLTASVDDIQAAVDAGALTYERLVEMYLRRIEAYDKNGPKLNAVLTMNPRAVEIARELDRERVQKGRRRSSRGGGARRSHERRVACLDRVPGPALQRALAPEDRPRLRAVESKTSRAEVDAAPSRRGVQL
jgi:hypothetical protein